MPNDQIERIAQAALAGEGAAQSASDAPTTQERVVDQATPSDGGGSDAVMYDIEVGGQKRKMTPQQIAGVLERYSTLNADMSEMGDVVNFARQMLQAAPGRTPKDLVAFLQQTIQGGQQQSQPPVRTEGPDEIEQQLRSWQERNAIEDLPPGLVDMIKSNRQMQQQMAQMTQMLTQVLHAGRNAAVGAEEALGQAQAEKTNVIQQRIVNNLNMAQQQLGLPDEAAQDFFTFAGERGYTMEDFINPDLTAKVMNDFKATMNAPEMERLRQMAQKRQAYTGSLGATPTQGGEVKTPGSGDPMLDRLVNRAMGS